MNSFKPDYFVILGSMRTGSNLLQDQLDQVEGLRCYGELFNPGFIGKLNQKEGFGFTIRERDAAPEKFIAAMREQSAPDLTGFRFFDGHSPNVMEKVIADPTCAKIILTRAPLHSYISLKIARETDQWLLKNPSRRKTTRVVFDAAEFDSYQQTVKRFYERIEQTLRDAGQAAFRIDYGDITNINAFNGLVRFLGLTPPENPIRPRLVRQNPKPLSDKVTNYAEMQQRLPGLALPTARPRVNIRNFYLCNDPAILYFHLPGCDETIRAGLQQALGGKLKTGFTRRELEIWRMSNRLHMALAVISDPMQRAYDCFCSHILPVEDRTFLNIRRYLVRQYDVSLPTEQDWPGHNRKELLALGHGIGAQRSAFHGFLKFVADNLSGKNNLRTDPRWLPQSELIESLTEIQPLTRILHECELPTLFNELGLKSAPSPARREQPFNLDELRNQQTAKLIRRAFARDYELLGFAQADD